nr:MFS transporter [Kineosporia mesophila]
MIGDQIAAVAVAVLLYQDSGSPLLAAAGYATAYVPWLLGGPLLAAWAERFAGRSVMVACDLGRALLIAIAALPGMPSLGVAGLVFLAAMFAPPFDAARSALLAQILTGNKYPVGMSLRQAVHQIAQLAGFALGGALVLALSAPGVLALNCLTFLASAALLRAGLVARPAPASETAETPGAEPEAPAEDEAPAPLAGEQPPPPARAPGVPHQRGRQTVPVMQRVARTSVSTQVPGPRSRTQDRSSTNGTRSRLRGRRAAQARRVQRRASSSVSSNSVWGDMIAGLKVVRGDAQIWFPLMLGIVGAAYAIVPEAIATAYAAELGHGSSVVGLIMAAAAAGSVVGGLAIGRFAAPRTASRLMYPLALVGTVPLLVIALRPGLTVSLAMFVLCGLGQAFQVVANTQFASSIPPAVRTRAFGIAIAGLYGGQSLAILLAGAAAQWLAPSTVIAASGLIGAAGLLLLPRLRPSVLRPRGRHSHQ